MLGLPRSFTAYTGSFTAYTDRQFSLLSYGLFDGDRKQTPPSGAALAVTTAGPARCGQAAQDLECPHFRASTAVVPFAMGCAHEGASDVGYRGHPWPGRHPRGRAGRRDV